MSARIWLVGTWRTLCFSFLGWHDLPVYAIVARDQQVIHFRCAAPPTANPDKYADELLGAYLFVEDADARVRISRLQGRCSRFRVAVFSSAGVEEQAKVGCHKLRLRHDRVLLERCLT